MGDGLMSVFADGGARLKKMRHGKPTAAFGAKMRAKDGGAQSVRVRAVLTRDNDGAAAYFALAVEEGGARSRPASGEG